MSLAFILLRAAHARGTHHYLALDALSHLAGPDSARWQKLLFAHIARFMDGAKAPDTQFKDFENHVLHPRDGFWGGAPKLAGEWYGKLIGDLKAQNWSEAAYSAGVLSHYVTDPMMPLHTHSTDAEANLHAPIEWTVSKSYAALREQGLAAMTVEIEPVTVGPDWIGELMRAGARQSTSHYETLLAHYDIKRGVVTPEEGFDRVGQRAVAEMVIFAARLFARILDRAIAESGVSPPEVSLTAQALVAVASLPKAWWTKRQMDRSDRLMIEAMYDELMSTGRVEQNLTEDERAIRAAFRDKVLAKRAALAVDLPTAASASAEVKLAATVQAAAPVLTQFVPRTPAPASMSPPPAANFVTSLKTDPVTVPQPAPTAVTQEPVQEPIAVTMFTVPAPFPIEVETAPSATVFTAPEPMSAATAAAVAASMTAPMMPAPPQIEPPADVPAAPESTEEPVPVPAEARPATVLTALRPSERGSRTRLTLDSPVVNAPSIGPKTAARLAAVGIDSVGDFLNAHPIALSSRLEASHLTPDVLTEWQDQTRLMIRLPKLNALNTQLLTGAGYRTLDAIADVDADQLGADLLRFATTPAGMRILRHGSPPDIEQIRAWTDQARTARAA